MSRHVEFHERAIPREQSPSGEQFAGRVVNVPLIVFGDQAIYGFKPQRLSAALGERPEGAGDS